MFFDHLVKIERKGELHTLTDILISTHAHKHFAICILKDKIQQAPGVVGL